MSITDADDNKKFLSLIICYALKYTIYAFHMKHCVHEDCCYHPVSHEVRCMGTGRSDRLLLSPTGPPAMVEVPILKAVLWCEFGHQRQLSSSCQDCFGRRKQAHIWQ